MGEVWFGLFGDKKKAEEGFLKADKEWYIRQKIVRWYLRDKAYLTIREDIVMGKQKTLF